jgi:hypothetical protein
MRTVLLLTVLSASLLFAQSPSVTEKEMPTVVSFVAPAYPRAAKDQRKMGKTITRIRVSPEGQLRRLRQSAPTQSSRNMS